ncbi:hypothetical protein DPMN_024137, partial [Dreissena polymorpha]
KLTWWKRPAVVIEMYQSVIVNLVSVHTHFLRPCLKMVIATFAPEIKSTKESESEVDEKTLRANNQAFVHAHNMLHAITKIVPMAGSTGMLLPLLGEMSPYQGKPTYVQECHMRNLLHITTYLPSLRQPIMEQIIHKMICYDVQAPRSKLVESYTDESEEGSIFKMEELGSCQEAADKLDVMMVLLFEYVKSVCFKNEELQWEATKQFYREMLYLFERIILPTYACSHVQFLMFYLTSLRSEICDGYLDYLWKLVQDPNMPAVHRQTAVTYMGSLLARGTFVGIRTVMRTIDLMMNWAHAYTLTCLETVMADLVHHAAFYSVCQAVFYVFAFRQKELFETKKGLKWAENLQIQHLVHSRLNPLKICLPLVVKTFSAICRQHQLAFCDNIIQRNARSYIPVVSDGTQKILEAYFPFDPYLLDRSKHYIEEQYRAYDKSMNIDDSSAEEDTDDEMFLEPELASPVTIGMATTPGSFMD